MNNSQGSYRTTKEAMMRAFDKLPPAIRKALSESHENWVPQVLLTRYKRGIQKGLSPVAVEKIILDKLAQGNREESADHWYRMERLQKRGIDYFSPIRRRKA